MPPKCDICGTHYWTNHPCECKGQNPMTDSNPPAFEFRSLADGDHPEVVVRGGHREMGVTAVLGLFEYFLRGCGYAVPFGSLNMEKDDE